MVETLEKLDVKKSLSAGKWLFLFLKTRGERKMENELRLAIKLYENKINKTEEEYKKKCNGDFDKEKMRKYVNRKLKRERDGLILINLLPTARVINLTKRFKY